MDPLGTQHATRIPASTRLRLPPLAAVHEPGFPILSSAFWGVLRLPLESSVLGYARRPEEGLLGTQHTRAGRCAKDWPMACLQGDARAWRYDL